MPSQQPTVQSVKPRRRSFRLREMQAERRLGERDRRMLDATMKYQGEFMKVELFDLSETGAYVVAPCTPSLSDSLTINIDLSHMGCTVMITGRVRRVGLSSRCLERSGGFGVEFTRFYTQAGRNDLREHLAA